MGGLPQKLLFFDKFEVAAVQLHRSACKHNESSVAEWNQTTLGVTKVAPGATDSTGPLLSAQQATIFRTHKKCFEFASSRPPVLSFFYRVIDRDHVILKERNSGVFVQGVELAHAEVLEKLSV